MVNWSMVNSCHLIICWILTWEVAGEARGEAKGEAATEVEGDASVDKLLRDSVELEFDMVLNLLNALHKRYSVVVRS